MKESQSSSSTNNNNQNYHKRNKPSQSQQQERSQRHQRSQTTTTTHPLEQLVQKPTKIITTDGRVFVGVLRGLDQALNCVISQAEERVYSLEKEGGGVTVHELGTYFIRGDSIVMVGEFNESQEDLEALKQVKCKPLDIL